MSWQTVKLGDVCEIVMGQAPSGDTYNEDKKGYPLIAGAGDFKNGCINVGKYTTKPTKISKANDIVISIRASIGDKVWVDDGYCLGRGVAALRASNKVDKNYLWHTISNVEKKLLSKGRGATFLQVNKDDIQSLEIPLPPLAEQKRIADILDKANEIKAKRELALVKLDKLSESCYKDLFGDINANEKQFKTQRLTEFFKFKTGKLDSNAAVLNGKYPFFTCAKEDFAINEFAFDEEALLLAGNNATADYSVKHYVGKFNAYQRTYVMNLQDSRNSYLFAKFSLQLMLNKLKNSSKGSGTKYLTMGIFNSLEIMVPPSNLQNEFNEKIIQIEKIKMQVLHGRNLMVSTISALQNQAFTTGFNA